MNAVRWRPSALNELAAIWVSARTEQRREISEDFAALEEQLAIRPLTVGESREFPARIAVMKHVVVEFDVMESDRLVIVTSVRPTFERR